MLRHDSGHQVYHAAVMPPLAIDKLTQCYQWGNHYMQFMDEHQSLTAPVSATCTPRFFANARSHQVCIYCLLHVRF